MSDLFRPEAIEHHARHQGPGDVLRARPRWVAWSFWLLLALVALGLTVGWLVRIDGDRLISVLIGLD